MKFTQTFFFLLSIGKYLSKIHKRTIFTTLILELLIFFWMKRSFARFENICNSTLTMFWKRWSLLYVGLLHIYTNLAHNPTNSKSQWTLLPAGQVGSTLSSFCCSKSPPSSPHNKGKERPSWTHLSIWLMMSLRLVLWDHAYSILFHFCVGRRSNETIMSLCHIQVVSLQSTFEKGYWARPHSQRYVCHRIFEPHQVFFKWNLLSYFQLVLYLLKI